jgi:protein involved in polysaccharide export with SLBB domain
MLCTRKRLGSCLVITLIAFSAPVHAQSNDRPRASREDSVSSRATEASELAKENLERVAASTSQVQAVLLKDPGILVELKNWVANEATESGQVVEDSALTDQAIFDRLDRDIKFRSLATRLVQRYGYLLPGTNPDSELGKQQDLILKERARRLVQIEAQEDSESLQPRIMEGNEGRRAERISACDPQRDQTCKTSPPSAPQTQSIPSGETPGSDSTFPIFPDQQLPRVPPMRMLRTGSGGLEGPTDAESNPSITINALRSSQAGRAQTGMPEDLAGAARSMGLENLPSLLERGLSPETTTPAREARTPAAAAERRAPLETELPPVTMVRKQSPYADIPALYDMYVQASSQDKGLERFGMAVFRNGSLSPEAVPMDLPVGPDYVVGPGDSLSINFWGGVAQRISRVVDREGRISLPEAGPVLVSGRTIGEVQQSVQQVMRTQYLNVFADVSLTKLRTVRVYVVGDVAEPGAYDISSLSTPLNALVAAGGVTSGGSMRFIKHYRGQQLIEQVDAYDLLLRGIRGDMARLENGDSLMVPPVESQVTVSGMVRRPAIYELHGETSLLDVVNLAGGILPAAALGHIEVQRLEAHEKHTMLSLNVPPESDATAVSKELSAFKIQDGDAIHIFPISSYNGNAIYLEGHVLRPGRYSYKTGMKLTDLISGYDDLLPEPAGHYAEIVRINGPDFRPSVESFDLSAALGNPAAAPLLQPLDTVRIFGKYDFEQAPAISIGGEVRSPGRYRTSGQTHLRDAIYLAGGVTPDAALDSAQLFRNQSDGTLKILSVNLGAALGGSPADNLVLEPRDRILVHRTAAKVDPPTVDVKGEVAKPGRYPLTTNMHVADLLQVAGGLRRSADPERADLVHYADGETGKNPGENLIIDLPAAASGNSDANVALHPGDVLTIRQRPGWKDIGASVTVRGEVEHPGAYGIRPGEELSSVILRAGGFSADGYPHGAILMRREVRDLEMQSHTELVERIKLEQAGLRAMPENDNDQKNAKLTALAQAETTLEQVQANAPVGRVVIHIGSDLKKWQNTPADVPLRDGDVLVIPKKPHYILVTGQVFNPTAISYKPGRSAKWYLSQAGGLTPLADKQAAFVIRADGSVIAAKNNAAWFSGDPMDRALGPGDSVVVPEKAIKVGGRNWASLMQAAQVASSVALTAAYVKP